jgi:hypothetical protein
MEINGNQSGLSSQSSTPQGDNEIGQNGSQEFWSRLGSYAEGDGIANYGSSDEARKQISAASRPVEVPHDQIGQNGSEQFWSRLGSYNEGDGIYNS